MYHIYPHDQWNYHLGLRQDCAKSPFEDMNYVFFPSAICTNYRAKMNASGLFFTCSGKCLKYSPMRNMLRECFGIKSNQTQDEFRK